MPILSNRRRNRKRLNPLKVDPTRTTTLRRQFEQALRARFDHILSALIHLVEVEDAFGLKLRSNNPFIGNTRWQFQSTAEQIASFEQWLLAQINQQVTGQHNADKLWEKFAQDGYARGTGRAFEDVKKLLPSSSREQLTFFAGTREQFLREAFANPVGVDRLKQLAGRTLTDIKGVSQQMANRMRTILTDGLARGENPRVITRELVKELKITKARASRIARTEIIRAHAEGQLDAFERLGVKEVGVAVEWSTAEDDLVCPLCESLNDEVMPISSARALIPRHPNCRCAWIPAEEKDIKKKRLETAIRRSVSRERGGKGRLDTTRWIGADLLRKPPKVRTPAKPRQVALPRDEVARIRNNVLNNSGRASVIAERAAASNMRRMTDTQVRQLWKDMGSPGAGLPLDTKEKYIEQIAKAMKEGHRAPIQTRIAAYAEYKGNAKRAEFISRVQDTADKQKRIYDIDARLDDLRDDLDKLSSKRRKTLKDRDRQVALWNEEQKLLDEIFKLRREVSAGKPQMFEQLADVYKVKPAEQAGVLLSPPANITREVQDQYELVERFMQSTVGKGRNNVDNIVMQATEAPKIRANYGADNQPGSIYITKATNQPRGTLHMSKGTDTGTIVHEFGHGVNDYNGVRESAFEFLDARTKGEKLEKLKDVVGGGYDDLELGRKDDWLKLYPNQPSRAWYTGKPYPDNTEIVSMGVELMYNNPVHFAKTDPEYFDFIMGVLNGDIR